MQMRPTEKARFGTKKRILQDSRLRLAPPPAYQCRPCPPTAPISSHRVDAVAATTPNLNPYQGYGIPLGSYAEVVLTTSSWEA